MYTIVIWNEFETDLEFFVLEGDYTRLDRALINSVSETDEEEKNKQELYDIVYDDNGYKKVVMYNSFPYQFTDNSEFAVIQAGFIP